jgi:hypothetical protein
MSPTRTLWLVPLVVLLALPPAGCSRIPIGLISSDAAVMKEEVVSRSFPTGATPHVLVDVFSGALTVTGGADGMVTAEVTKRRGGSTEAEALEKLKEVEVTMTQEGDHVRITVPRPPGNVVIGEAPAKLQVPAGAVLDLRTAFGAVRVTGVTGDITTKTSNGAVAVQGGKGRLRLTTSFGKVEVDGAHAAVTAETSNGPVTVKGTHGPLDLTTSFGAIEVDAPSEAVKATTSNGAIKIRGARGRVRASTSFGGVEVEAANATVAAETSNGSVKFTGTLADGEHTLHTSFGGISVTLPADARFRLDAQTSFGKVTTGFDLRPASGSDKTHLRGTVGDNPAVSLKLTTSNGNIEVRPGK